MSFNHFSGGCAPLPTWVETPSPIKDHFPEEQVSEDSGLEDFRFPLNRPTFRSRSWSMCSTLSGHSFCSYTGKSKSVQLEDTVCETQHSSFPQNAHYNNNEQSALLKKTTELEQRLHKLESNMAERTQDKVRHDSALASLQRDVASFTHAKNLLQQKLNMYEAAQDKKFRLLQEQNTTFQEQMQEDLARLENKLNLSTGVEENIAQLQQEHESMIQLMNSGYSAEMAGLKNEITLLEKQIRMELTRFEEEMRRWASHLMIAAWKQQREDKLGEPEQENVELEKLLDRTGQNQVAQLESLLSRFESEKHDLAQQLESHYKDVLNNLRAQHDNEHRQQEIRMSNMEKEFLKEKSLLQNNHTEIIRGLQSQLAHLKKVINELEDMKTVSKFKEGHAEEAFMKLREEYEDAKIRFEFQLKAKDEEIENLQAQVVEGFDQVLHFQKKMKKINQGKHQELEEQDRHLRTVEDELFDVKREFNQLEDEHHRVQNTLDEKDAEIAKLRSQLNEIYYHAQK